MRPHDRKPGRRGLGIAAALLVLAPAAAIAAAPDITSGPTVSGTPEVGQTLTGEAEWDGSPSWRWMRCDGDEPGEGCAWIADARARTYTATDADLGKRLRVMLTVRFRDATESGVSPPTGAVAATPSPTPTPTPTATPTPTPEPSPEPQPSAAPEPATPAAAPQPAGGVLGDAAASPLRMMSPVPVVRIRGRLTLSGARITLLTVRAPRGARISLRCYGRGCPARRWVRIASTTRLLRFERELRAGTKLVIRVTKAGRIGKYTTIVIRKNRVPKRSDRCLYPGRSRPAACPAA